MKVRRIRYGKPYEYAEYYGRDPETTEPKMFWRDWRVIAEYEDAIIRQLDQRHRHPGTSYQLRIPLTDPETGGDRDVDGDPAVLRVEMVGGDIDIVSGPDRLTIKGFVSQAEIEYEKAYRAGSYGDTMDSYAKGLDNRYVREEWMVVG
jgi:hypothetical protein